MRKLILLIFLFVAFGKFHQVVEYNTPLGPVEASRFLKKSDKSPVFKDNFCISKSRLGKAKKRKPKGVEIKSLGLTDEDFAFQYFTSISDKSQYCSPELTNSTLFIMGRAPPLA